MVAGVAFCELMSAETDSTPSILTEESSPKISKLRTFRLQDDPPITPSFAERRSRSRSPQDDEGVSRSRSGSLTRQLSSLTTDVQQAFKKALDEEIERLKKTASSFQETQFVKQFMEETESLKRYCFSRRKNKILTFLLKPVVSLAKKFRLKPKSVRRRENYRNNPQTIESRL